MTVTKQEALEALTKAAIDIRDFSAYKTLRAFIAQQPDAAQTLAHMDPPTLDNCIEALKAIAQDLAELGKP